VRTGDDLLVARAARRLAVQIAAIVAATLLVLMAVVAVVVVHEQDTATEDLLTGAAKAVDDVDDPPPGTWLTLVDAVRSDASPGLPKALLPRLAELRTAAAVNHPVTTAVRAEDRRYRVLTKRSTARTVQVVVDLEPQRRERTRLLEVLGIAAAASLLTSVGVGVFLGRRAVAPLADALRLQRNFVADASHELRTPLTLLSTRAQVLLRELRASVDTPALLADATGLVEDTQRLGEVVEDLLVAADPQATAKDEEVDLAATAVAVVDAASAHAVENGVALTGPRSTEQAVVVAGSAAALRRALLSLVDNAIDHTPRDGRVEVLVGIRDRDAVLTVNDSGPGVPEGTSHDLFRRFHSGGHRAGRAHYGLGLALVQEVAERHGGRVRLAPSDAGASFELILPLAPPRRL
jgi:signal transduction histidine kinase